ncbi:hypothetical protein ACIPRL_18055 [Streptomyces sp. NPDC090085]|uniref:hypothetical protein n=1 Tax=Streptomyces sp. NPDC090085 TaxID=3365943 RepID=UPI00382994A9
MVLVHTDELREHWTTRQGPAVHRSAADTARFRLAGYYEGFGVPLAPCACPRCGKNQRVAALVADRERTLMLGRYVCGATAQLPEALALAALEIEGFALGSPESVKTYLRCTLEHADGPHRDIVRDLSGDSAVWTEWTQDNPPEIVRVRLDCPFTDRSPGGTGDGCSQYKGHPGGHTWEISDPLYASVQARAPEILRAAGYAVPEEHTGTECP